jgi:hypothetical protein
MKRNTLSLNIERDNLLVSNSSGHLAGNTRGERSRRRGRDRDQVPFQDVDRFPVWTSSSA